MPFQQFLLRLRTQRLVAELVTQRAKGEGLDQVVETRNIILYYNTYCSILQFSTENERQFAGFADSNAVNVAGQLFAYAPRLIIHSGVNQYNKRLAVKAQNFRL